MYAAISTSHVTQRCVPGIQQNHAQTHLRRGCPQWPRLSRPVRPPAPCYKLRNFLSALGKDCPLVQTLAAWNATPPAHSTAGRNGPSEYDLDWRHLFLHWGKAFPTIFNVLPTIDSDQTDHAISTLYFAHVFAEQNIHVLHDWKNILIKKSIDPTMS